MVLTATGVIFSSELILPGQSRPVLPTDGHTGRIQCKSFQVHFPNTQKMSERVDWLSVCLTVTLKATVKLQPARHKSSPPLPRCSSERCHVTKGRLPTWEREREREREREKERERERERELLHIWWECGIYNRCESLLWKICCWVITELLLSKKQRFMLVENSYLAVIISNYCVRLKQENIHHL